MRSKPSTLVNILTAYKVTKQIKLGLEVLNVFDTKVSDIDYLYASQLHSETTSVADIHTHPAEPRTLRASVNVKFQ